MFDSAAALQRAKSNVEKYYPVVGVLERMPETLKIMEKLLPNVFIGQISQNYHGNRDHPLTHGIPRAGFSSSRSSRSQARRDRRQHYSWPGRRGQDEKDPVQGIQLLRFHQQQVVGSVS